MTIDERKFVVTALELLREISPNNMHPSSGDRVSQAIKALEVALGV